MKITIANELALLENERVNYMLENYLPSASYQNAEDELDNLMKIVEKKCGREIATAVDNLNIDILDEFLNAAYRQGVADALKLSTDKNDNVESSPKVQTKCLKK